MGREDELRLIADQLGAQGNRLLTLTGPGGTGKTRLALEVAAQLEARYAHGACFVACVSVTQISQLPSAIADALGLLGHADPEQGVRDYVQGREVLLVMDNLEQLCGQNLEFVTLLLSAAPGLSCLVTSREPLRLLGESVFDLWGLPYPPSAQPDGDFTDGQLSGSDLEQRVGDVDAIADFDAVRLFVQAARHAQVKFRLDADNAPGVARIAQLVVGMPLGLELAAAWTPVLTPSEIALELAQSLDAISSSNPGLPERHRSFRAVFERSWQRLSAQEQSAFERLGVFRGGFSRDAALSIAQASSGILLSLVQKSLLRRNAAGRFELHELIRQFLNEKLFDIAVNAGVTPADASSAVTKP